MDAGACERPARDKTKLVVRRLYNLPKSSHLERFVGEGLLTGLTLAPGTVLSVDHKSFTNETYRGKESFHVKEK